MEDEKELSSIEPTGAANVIATLLILGFLFGNPLGKNNRLTRHDLITNINESDLSTEEKKDIINIILK